MEIDLEKLTSVVNDLVKITPRFINTSCSVAIGETKSRVVVITVMSKACAKEESVEVNEQYNCITN